MSNLSDLIVNGLKTQRNRQISFATNRRPYVYISDAVLLACKQVDAIRLSKTERIEMQIENNWVDMCECKLNTDTYIYNAVKLYLSPKAKVCQYCDLGKPIYDADNIQILFAKNSLIINDEIDINQIKPNYCLFCGRKIR